MKRLIASLIAVLMVLAFSLGLIIGRQFFPREVTETVTWKVPVTVTYSTISTIATVTITSSAPTSPYSSKHEGLDFTIGRFYKDSLGFCHVVGEVTNYGSTTARWVELIATFYDEAGNVVGTASAFTDPEHIPPGSTAPYEIVWIDKNGCSQAKRVKVTLTHE